MNYSIIGAGNVGRALARLFALKNIEVAIANSRGPKTLGSLTKELGPSVVPQSAPFGQRQTGRHAQPRQHATPLRGLILARWKSRLR
jgi:hypothetical protein